jgi:hypothetical protein
MRIQASSRQTNKGYAQLSAGCAVWLNYAYNFFSESYLRRVPHLTARGGIPPFSADFGTGLEYPP